MLTGPGSSVELARLIADRGARSVLVVTDKRARRARGRRPGVERVEGGWPRGDGVLGGRARSDHRHRHGGDRAAPGVGGDSGACGRRRLADRRREGHDRMPRERPSSAGPRWLLQGPRPRHAVLRGSDYGGQRLGGDRRFRRLRSGGRAEIRHRRQQARSSGDRARSEPHDRPAAARDRSHGYGRAHACDRVPPLDTRHAGDARPVRGRGARDLSRSAPGLRGRSRHRRSAEPCCRVLPRGPRLHQGERRLRPRDRPPTRPALPPPARAPERDLAPVRARLLHGWRRLADGGARVRLRARSETTRTPGPSP